MNDISVQFVCLGNICRSPLAEGVFRHLVQTGPARHRYSVTSTGIGGWHAGNTPDRRSIAVARQNGIDISNQRARQFDRFDFNRNDLIIAMDRANLQRLSAFATSEQNRRLHLFSVLAHGHIEDVPDPYHGGMPEFEAVYSMILSGCEALFAKLEGERPSRSGKTSSVK